MCKNHKHSYTSVADDHERTPIHNCYKENKIPRTTTNKGCKEHQHKEEFTKRGHKQMEKHSMFIIRKNQYSENGYTAQSNLQNQCYPH